MICKKSVLKSLSWRVIATLTTMSLVLIFTGEVTLAVEIGLVEVIAKLTLYYLHERAWLRIPVSIHGFQIVENGK